MDTREVAAEYRLGQWAQMIQARAQSRQSIKDHCASTGISRNAYFYWQRKLREAACTELVAKERECDNSVIPSGWARIETSEDVRPKAAVSIEINGCSVKATSETDPDLLAKVCRVLKAL